MANPGIKSIKILSDIKLKQEAEAKHGLTVSGSIKDSCDVGLHVEQNALFDQDLAVIGRAYAAGFTQVGALDVTGLLQVIGHLVVTETLKISGSADFLSIPQVVRDGEKLYFVDDAVHALDERIYGVKNKINNNKQKFESEPTISGIAEFDSIFPWSDASFISVDIMVYNPSSDSWTNYFTNIEMKKNNLNNVRFVLTVGSTQDTDYVPGTKIRIIATRQTDITF
jgi:hypothetical protein